MSGSITLPSPYPSIPSNVTSLGDYCTIALCPLSLAHVQYVPNLAGNAFYASIFGLVLLIQLGLGVRYRTWGFAAGMFLGLLCEVIGYIARIQMHDNPFREDPFLMYLITLTIGPAFLSGSIYLCLARLVVAFSESTSRIAPRTLTLGFMGCDFIALLLQAIGGALASTADTENSEQIGINIMIAGVAWQVVSLVLFIALCTDYSLRVRKSCPSESVNPAFQGIRRSRKFRGFLIALAIATLAILIRSGFRCAELSQGFDGRLANEQVTFMILEGGMIAVAVISLTVFHPGLAFQGKWADAGWKLGSKRHGESTSMAMNTIHQRASSTTSLARREVGDEESMHTISYPTSVIKGNVNVGHASA